MTTTRRLLCSAALAAVLRPGAAPAQSVFPSRPIRLLVPYAAGGGTDAVARLVAQGMGERLGHTVVVENSGVAGGNLATQQAASAPPDGYTVLMANQGPMVVNPHLFKNLKVNPLTAFDPVTMITDVPLVVVVPKNSKYNSLAGLIEGIADWVRLNCDLSPPHWRRETEGKWDRGYQHTAYFLQYLEGRFGEGTIRRMNEKLRSRA